MNLTYRMPPDLRRSNYRNIAELNDWCQGLMMQLKYAFSQIPDNNAVQTEEEIKPEDTVTVYLDTPLLYVTDKEITFRDADGNDILYMNHKGYFELSGMNGQYIIRHDTGEIDIKASRIEADTIINNGGA